MKKRILAATITAMMVLSLAACGGGKTTAGSASTVESKAEGQAAGDSAAGDASTAAEKVTLSLIWWGNQTRNDVTKQVVDLYMSQNPNVEIKVEFTDWSGYWDKLSAMAAGGNLPDIIQQDYAYINQYKKSGQLADLSEFINNGTIDTSKIPESIIASGSIDGKCYALSLGSNAPMMIYDKAIVEEAGVTIPEHMTIDELYDISQQIYEKTGTKGYFAGGIGMMAMVSRANGSYMFDEINAGQTDAASTHFANVVKFNEAEFAISPDLLAEKNPDIVETKPIIDGTTWNDFAFSNQYISISSAAGRDFGIVMYPTLAGAKAESMYLKPSQFFSITESSQNKEEAAKFINWFTNSVEANEILKAERGIPINTEVAAAIKPNADAVSQVIFDYIDAVGEIAAPIDPPDPAGKGEVEEFGKLVVEDLRYGDLDAVTATDKFLTEASRILTEAAK